MGARPLYTWQQSLEWLRSQREHESKDWTNRCAELVGMAGGFAGCGHDSASAWGNTVPKHLRHHGVAPRGGIYFWVTGAGHTGNWGHVAFSLGDGRVLCNVGSEVAAVHTSYYAGLGTPFFVNPEAPVFGSAFGKNPWPVKPRPVDPVVARPGTRSAAVPRLRKALGGKSVSTYYGAWLTRQVKAWQRAHGVRADGVVRASQLSTIVK